jgi:hypothetical protein
MSCIKGPRFAQFVRSNVCIKQNSSTEYTLTLCKLAPITLYQIVSQINPDLNNKRFIENINLGKYSELLKNDNNIDLTSIMDIHGQQYGFVLKSKTTRIINCNKLRFEVTTSIIDNKTKNVSTNLPSGFFKNAVTLVSNISYSPDECPFPSDKIYYNNFVSGNINIQKEGDYQYKITFKKSGIFTSYQIRNTNVRTREIINFSPEVWVNNFRNYLGLTSLMRLKNGCIYGFVLTNAFYKNNIMTWLVTTNQIFNKSSTVANGFKTGNFNDVIFDIDPVGDNFVDTPFFTQIPIDPNLYIKSATFNSSSGVLNFNSTGYTFILFPFPLDTLYTTPYLKKEPIVVIDILNYINYPSGTKDNIITTGVGSFVNESNLYQDFPGLSFSSLPFRLIIIIQPFFSSFRGLFYCDVYADDRVKLLMPT